MPGGELFSVVRTLLALLGVCALAWVVLRALAQRGIGVAARGVGRVRVLERVSLGPRQKLYLVRADERTLLIGGSDGGALSLIAELGPQAHDGQQQDATPTPTNDAKPIGEASPTLVEER